MAWCGCSRKARQCRASSGGGAAGWSVSTSTPYSPWQRRSSKALRPFFGGMYGWVFCAKSWQLAWSQQGRTEQVRQTLFHLFHRWHGNLGAVTKLGMGTGLRMLLHHGGPPLLRVPHDSAYDCLELKLRPVDQGEQAARHTYRTQSRARVSQASTLVRPASHRATLGGPMQLAVTPKVGAGWGSTSRPDLCRGCRVTGIPTAILRHSRPHSTTGPCATVL